MSLTIVHFLVLSAILVGAGIVTMALKRNAIGILMGAELIASAASLNFAAFNAYLPKGGGGVRVDGAVFALCIIVLAALQAGMGVAVFLNLYVQAGTVDVEDGVSHESPKGGRGEDSA